MNPCGILLAILTTAGADGAASTTPSPSIQDPAPAPEYPQWSGALSAGFNFTEGNSITNSANATFNAQRRAEKDRYTFDGFWNWATQAGNKSEPVPPEVPDEDDTELTQRNYGVGAKYDYFSSPKVYYFGNASGKVDDVATLDYRYTLGSGLGYQWTETEKLKFGTEAGLSFVQEDYVDNDENARFLALRLASNLAWQISKSASFDQVTELLPSLNESEDLLAKFDNRLKLLITGKWFAQLQYVLDYDDSTPPGVEEADHRIVASIGWNFGS